MRQFTTQNTIEGMDDYDPQSFLTALREVVTIFLRTNRGTKVKLIIRYNMERASIVSESGTITEQQRFILELRLM